MSSSPDDPSASAMRNPWGIDEDEAGFLQDFVRLNQVRTVLEFGPGRSTQSFLDVGCLVWSLEHDPAWLEKARQQLAHQQALKQLLLYAVEPELRIPQLEQSSFDIAFIDGPPASFFRHFARLNAIEFAAARTNVILLHDANREMECNSMLVMEEKGWHWRVLRSARGLAVGVKPGAASLQWPKEGAVSF
jgi:predicted O-methyltransferase YrrM